MEWVDRYHTAGTTIQQLGWKALDRPSEKKTVARSRGVKESEEDEAESALPSDLAVGQAQDVIDAQAQKKSTKPPKRLTEGTLLTAMETAGKSLEKKELSDAMNESGLGTPATRAAIIEVVLKRGYIERNGKSLAATEKGIRLIEVVPPEVKSPAMTSQWEAYLQASIRALHNWNRFSPVSRTMSEMFSAKSQHKLANKPWTKAARLHLPTARDIISKQAFRSCHANRFLRRQPVKRLKDCCTAPLVFPRSAQTRSLSVEL